MEESDCVVVQGSNMAECHPVAFRWPMVAKSRGAKIIHVDPRFTRTSAMADIYAPIRAGSDIAFLGGLINYVINHQRWNSDGFFRQFVVNYTNAATIITDAFKDTDDLDGVFSGLMQYEEKLKEWPYNGFLGQYDNKSTRAPRSSSAAGRPPRSAPASSRRVIATSHSAAPPPVRPRRRGPRKSRRQARPSSRSSRRC
jgi:formate dehydrogenase major subunit